MAFHPSTENSTVGNLAFTGRERRIGQTRNESLWFAGKAILNNTHCHGPFCLLDYNTTCIPLCISCMPTHVWLGHFTKIATSSSDVSPVWYTCVLTVNLSWQRLHSKRRISRNDCSSKSDLVRLLFKFNSLWRKLKIFVFVHYSAQRIQRTWNISMKTRLRTYLLTYLTFSVYFGTQTSDALDPRGCPNTSFFHSTVRDHRLNSKSSPDKAAAAQIPGTFAPVPRVGLFTYLHELPNTQLSTSIANVLCFYAFLVT